jgi:allophanate hydrolase subunit 1
METPGGWQLVGRTPIKPFDPDRAEPFLLTAGDAVQFYAIDGDEFVRVEREGFLVPPKPPRGEGGSRASS